MKSILENKRILLCLTGGIAAYKAADITSRLIKEGARVKVIMTKNAVEFIQPLTFETLSENPVYTDTFTREGVWEIDHISLAKWADLILIAPATANIIGKLRIGIADDLLTTTLLASPAPVMIAPAMNTQMYVKEAVQENINVLKKRGVHFIAPGSGRLACGDWGEGKLADVDDIITEVHQHFANKMVLSGMRILVTAGPTREAIDPVRFISNPSSGKMGYAIADACYAMGAHVDLVSGPTNLSPIAGVNVHRVESAVEMHQTAMSLFQSCDIVFMTAAVGDYRPDIAADNKIKKDSETLTLKLIKNPDILKEMGQNKTHQILVGFAAETQKLEEYAKKKIQEKNLDFILANDVTLPGAGFQADTNMGVLIFRNGQIIPIPQMKKQEFAQVLINEVVKHIAI